MTEVLTPDSLFAINNFVSPSFIKKRITHELNEIVKVYSLISVNFDPSLNLLDIIIEDTEHNNIYKFVIGNQYPFKPPQIFVNLKPYLSILNIKSVEFGNHLSELIGQNCCLCCNTITRDINWSPCYTLEKLILEIRQFQWHRRAVTQKITTEQNGVEIDSKKVNLIADINWDL